MTRRASLRATYLIRGEAPLLGWCGTEQVLFRPSRVEIELTTLELIRISGLRIDIPGRAEAAFGFPYAPLEDAPDWALARLAAAKNMLNGAS